MALEVAEDSLSTSPGAAARWAGVQRESPTRATDLVSGPGGGGRDLEMADSFWFGLYTASFRLCRRHKWCMGSGRRVPAKAAARILTPNRACLHSRVEFVL